MHFITLGFLVSQERFHRLGRPFVLVYSVAQDLVSYQHFAQPSDQCAILGTWPWPQSLVEHDPSCLEAVFAWPVRLTQTHYAQMLVQQYDRLFYCNLFFLSTSFFLLYKTETPGCLFLGSCVECLLSDFYSEPPWPYTLSLRRQAGCHKRLVGSFCIINDIDLDKVFIIVSIV